MVPGIAISLWYRGTAPYPCENVPSATSASHVPICRLEDEATALSIYRASHQNESVARQPISCRSSGPSTNSCAMPAGQRPVAGLRCQLCSGWRSPWTLLCTKSCRLDATAQPVTLEVSVAFPARHHRQRRPRAPRSGWRARDSPGSPGGHRRSSARPGDLVAARAGRPSSDKEGESVVGGHDGAGCLLRSYRHDHRGGHHRLLPNTNQESPGPYATETKSDKHRQNQDVEPHMHSKDQDYACSQQQQRSEHAGTKSGTSLIPEYLHLKGSDHGKNNQLGTKRPVQFQYDQDRNQKDRRVQA